MLVVLVQVCYLVSMTWMSCRFPLRQYRLPHMEGSTMFHVAFMETPVQRHSLVSCHKWRAFFGFWNQLLWFAMVSKGFKTIYMCRGCDMPSMGPLAPTFLIMVQLLKSRQSCRRACSWWGIARCMKLAWRFQLCGTSCRPQKESKANLLGKVYKKETKYHWNMHTL